MLKKRAKYIVLVCLIAEQIGITNALGIDLRIKDGCYTSTIQGVPSYREGKVIRLKEWLQSQPDKYSVIHFYTDSINDLPLCEFADKVYLVNPCPQLLEQAQHHNWTKLNWE
ncbi:haloacid dehalogenase-like hydrolase [Vibrio hepatarius]|nr:haloacid dehalogenase-like hydrolase [Vibrio hepatarius]